MNELINLTPHAIHIMDALGTVKLTVPPSGSVARCATSRELATVLEVTAALYVQVHRTTFGVVTGLPDPVPGTYCVVSSLVAQAARERTDLLIPDDTVRDSEGRIVGCRALARV